MKKCLFYIMSAAILFSCSKESVNVAPEQESNALIYKTFTASSDDTKTYLDGMSVKWADGDKINVVAYGTGNQYTFTLKSGKNTSSAVFEGSIAAADAEETQFIAVYPDVNVAINKDADPAKEIIEYLSAPSGDHVKYFETEDTPVKAIKGGFDSRYAPMTAVLSGDNFAFRHGAAYFKLRMSEDGVKTVKLAAGGGARFNGRPKYYLSTGLNSTVENAKANIYASPEVGTFEKNAVYYIPVLTKQSNTGDLTITYTKEDGTTSSSVKTSVLSSKKLTAGLIYDLGTPPVTFSPFIKADDMTINANATEGNITFTVYNPAGGVVTAALTDGKVNNISDFNLGAVDGSTIPFTCDANTGGEEKKAYVTITYTYNDSETVTKDVVITQKAAGAKEAHSWNFVDYSDAEMESITGRAANVAASAGTVWNFGDGLTMTTNSSSKWDNQIINEVSYKYVATGGSYGSNQKFFQFTTESTGTITVQYAAGGSSSRALTVNANGSETTDSSNISTGTSDLKTVVFSSVASGTIKLYSKDNNIRVYSIDFIEN